MDEKYKLVGVKGPEVNDTDITFLNRNPFEYDLPPVSFVDYVTDDTIPMKITVEVRKFWFWWKA